MNTDKAIQQQRKRQRNRQIIVKPLSSISDEKVPANDSLERVDDFLSLPKGTTYKIVILHGDSTVLNEKLSDYEIRFDPDGILPREYRPKWKSLMQYLGVSKEYWMDPEALHEAMLEDMRKKLPGDEEMDQLNIFN